MPPEQRCVPDVYYYLLAVRHHHSLPGRKSTGKAEGNTAPGAKGEVPCSCENHHMLTKDVTFSVTLKKEHSCQ